MHRTYEIDILLLLEGLSVPVSAAQISFGINQPAVASFDLVPLKELLDIKPRTFAQFFVKDYMNDNEFKLAFEGEVYATGFAVHAAGQRAFQIQCMDMTNYWDHVPLRFLDVSSNTITNPEISTGIQQDSIKTTTILTDVSNYLAEELSKMMTENKNDVAKALEAFIEKFANINAFYKSCSDRYKMPSRVSAASSENISATLKFKTTTDLMKGLVQARGGDRSFREVLMYFLSMAFHEVVTVPFPTYADSTIKQYLFKPHAMSLAPPKCNIVFPNLYTSMNINRNFFAEPTRLLMKVPPTSLIKETPAAFDRLYPAPAFYEKILQSRATNENRFVGAENPDTTKGINNGQYGTKADGNHPYSKVATQDFMNFSKEEMMKGIFSAPTLDIPDVIQFMISEAKENNPSENMDTMLADTAYYMYYRGRYAQRTSHISGRLNIGVVPGFPVMFIDDQDSAMNVVAVLENVTHTFSGAGNCGTHYQISHARQVEEKADFTPNTFAEPPVPPWFDRARFGETQSASSVFSTKGAGAELRKELGTVQGFVTNFGSKMNWYYQSLLGCDVSTDENNKSIMEAARRYAKEFANAEDKEAYTRDIIKRKFATITDAMKFMGATGSVSAQTGRATTAAYSGGLLTTSSVAEYADVLKKRRDVIVKYKDRLGTNKSFNGS
jgi:hypothetical protein